MFWNLFGCRNRSCGRRGCCDGRGRDGWRDGYDGFYDGFDGFDGFDGRRERFGHEERREHNGMHGDEFGRFEGGHGGHDGGHEGGHGRR